MLVQQAIAAAEYFFEQEIDSKKSEMIYKNLLRKKQNIVLVGMPGCGKSTVGKKLAKELDREFFDTDVLITEKTGKSPSQIITEQGENTFREIETSICKDLSAKTGVVISTGGGVILRNENVFYLKNNGIMFFIDRNLEKIKATEDRPLSNSLDKLKQIYEVRYPIYKNNSDFQIISDENLYNTINKIKNKF